MAFKKRHIRSAFTILSMIWSLGSTNARAFSGQPVSAGEAVIGAEAHIYHVYCENIPEQIALAPGYGLVVASIKTNGYVTQALIFSAKISVLEPLCLHPTDLQYQKALVNVDNFTPAKGGEIVFIK